MRDIKKNIIAITGASGVLGRPLAKALAIDNTVITLGRHNCDYYYELGMNINDVIPPEVCVTHFFHLAYDRSRKLIGGIDSNLYSAKQISVYCKANDIRVVYISSMAALSASSEYGRNKRGCELLFEGDNDSNKIVRLGMLYGEKLGLIYKIKQLVGHFKFCPMPGNGKFLVYLANIDKVTDYLCAMKFPRDSYIYLVETPAIYFSHLINPMKKKELHIPIFLIKLLLYIPHKFGFKMSSISYDGFVGLINPPKLPNNVVLFDEVK